MSTASKLANITTDRRARVIATFRRFSPPVRVIGPKLSGSGPPEGCFENATENRIVSRSSPCTFSRFFTKSASVSWWSFWWMSGSSLASNRSRMRLRCWVLKVTTPRDSCAVMGLLRRSLISATMACASTSLVRCRRPGCRLNWPSTRFRLTPAAT